MQREGGGCMTYLYHQIGNCNPAGVEINPGWYALLGAILGLSVEEALHKICKTPYGGERTHYYRQKKGCTLVWIDKKKFRQAMDRKGYTYRIIGELLNVSHGKVARMMRERTDIEFAHMVEEALDLNKGELILKEDMK